MKKSNLMINSRRAIRGSNHRRRKLDVGGRRRLYSEHLELRAMLNGDWHNPVEATDVNSDGVTSPIDALYVINELNINGARALDDGTVPHQPGMFYDVYKDGHLSPLDAITVLNAIGAEGEDEDLVQIRLSTTALDGTPLTQVNVGQDFLLRATVQDITGRDSGGVFAAYLDVTYESNLVSINGSIEHGDDYGNAPAGNLSTPGLIDEAGSIDGLSELGFDELLLFTIPMTADANGSVTFLPDPADLSPAHDVLIFGVTADGLTRIPSERIAYIPATLQVGEAASIVAANDSYNVLQDTVLIVGEEEGVLVNDTNPFGGSLVPTIVDTVENGELTLSANGSLTYTPDEGFVGTDTFTYQASVNGSTSNIATVTLNVMADNAVPVAVSDTYLVDEDQVLTTTVSVLSNDSDANGDSLTASLINGPSNGTLTLATDGQFVYTPNANFSGTDSFVYAANDGVGNSNPVGVTITVNGMNDAPVAASESYDTAVGSSVTIGAASGVLSNDTDVDGDTLTARLVTAPSNGSVNLNEDGALVYTPNSGFVGTDSFTYVANDGVLDSNVVTVSIDVQGEVVTQVRLRLATTDLGGAPISSIGPGGEFLLQVLVQDVGTPPMDGVFAAYADVLYDADLVAINGPVTFGAEYANVQSGNVTVDGLIDELGAIAALTPLGGGEFLLASIPMVANGIGTADFSSNAAEDVPAHEILLFGESVPVATEFVDYGTAQLQIIGGDAPVAIADSYETDEDVQLTVNASAGVLANDSDADGNTLRAVLVDGAANGQVELNDDGSFTYSANDNFNGTDSFTYRANDGAQSSAVTTVTIEVNPIDDLPVATADNYRLNSVGDLVVSAANGVLANDVDVDGDTLSARLVEQPVNGTVTLNADGSFSYSPMQGFVGVDTFTYEATAGETASAETLVTIEVGDTSPSSISGFVFSDTDNDGVFDAHEARYGGVRIRLQGMDLLGNMISEEVRTGADGSYQFTKILQGSYTVTEFQPLHLVDGKDRINGGPLSLRNDRYEIELVAGRTLTNYNFGERGLEPQFITNPMFFASRVDHGLLAMTNGAGKLEWYCMDQGWDGISEVNVELTSNQSAAEVTVENRTGGSASSRIGLDANRSARLLTGSPSQGYLVRFTGSSSDFGLTPSTDLDIEAVDQLFGA